MNEPDNPSATPPGGMPSGPAENARAGAGRFTLIRLIGRGGMGVVWLARDEALHEDVALKFLPAEVAADPAALHDLRRETRRSRSLTHPNIIRIHDFFEVPGETAFIAMEYVEGPTLTTLRLQQPEACLSWEFLRPLVIQLCNSLEYAHGENVIHRDLKPMNLMLDSKGRLKLADFGLSATLNKTGSRYSLRHVGSGTPLYMSPQQINGERPQTTDDVYSLGATLYELLTGTPPFYEGEIIHQVLHTPATPLRERLADLQINNEIPPDVEALIMACLAKDPAQRPQSARAIAEWIGGTITLNESSAPASAGDWDESDPEKPSGSRSIAYWIAAVILAVIVVGIGGWFLTKQSREQKQAETATIPSPKLPLPTVVPPAQSTADSSLIFKEDFETVDAEGKPKDWLNWTNEPPAYGKSIQQEAGNHFLEMYATNAYSVRLWRNISLPPRWNAFRVSMRVRLKQFKPKPVESAGVNADVRCLAGDGETVLRSADLEPVTTPGGWRTIEGTFQATPETKYVSIILQLFNCGAVVDFDDVTVTGIEMPTETVVYLENFENAAPPAEVRGWNFAPPSPLKSHAIKAEAGNQFLECAYTATNSVSFIGGFDLLVQPRWKRLRFSVRARSSDLQTDSTTRGAGFLVIGYWQNQSHQNIAPWRFQTQAMNVSGDWRTFEVTRDIFPGATYARFNFLFANAAGTVDLDDVRVTVTETNFPQAK